MADMPFIRNGEDILIDAPYVEIYIRDALFGDPSKAATVACEYADGIKSVGIFNIRIFDSENQNRNEPKLRTFNYPNTIITYPTEVTTETIDVGGDVGKFRILKYYKGDVLMSSQNKQGSDNCEFFLNLLISGKIPHGISYDDVVVAWIQNFKINSVNPGVPYVTLQVIISEMYRYSKDPVKQFRKVAGTGDAAYSNDYISVNMNEVSSYSSVMSALTFERFSDKLTTSINMTKSGVQQNKSPVERLLSM